MCSTEKEKNFVSVVAYVHDSEKTLEAFLDVVGKFLESSFASSELIFVNDDSRDESVNIIRKKAKELEGVAVTLLDMSYCQGVELSMNAGVDLAIGDYVYEFDSTLVSYDPSILKEVYSRCLEGFDIVAAIPKDVQHRTSNIFYRLYNKHSRSAYDINTEGFRLLSRRAINRVGSMSVSLPYRKAVYANSGLAFSAVAYSNTIRIPSAKKAERSYQLEVAQNALIYYTDVAYKGAVGFASAMILVFCAIAIYALAIWLCGKPVEGWTATTLFLSFGFCGIGLILLVLIKYAELILRTVFTKNRYLIRSINKLNRGDES